MRPNSRARSAFRSNAAMSALFTHPPPDSRERIREKGTHSRRRQKLESVHDPLKIKAWLLRIVSWRALDRVRARRLHDDIDEDDYLAPEPEAPSAVAETRLLAEAVEDSLGLLPTAQRRCWVLRVVGGPQRSGDRRRVAPSREHDPCSNRPRPRHDGARNGGMAMSDQHDHPTGRRRTCLTRCTRSTS